MNQITYLTWLFDEFGFKVRWIYADISIAEAFRDYLILHDRYSIWEYIKMLGQYGVIEVIDIMDEAALQFIPDN